VLWLSYYGSRIFSLIIHGLDNDWAAVLTSDTSELVASVGMGTGFIVDITIKIKLLEFLIGW
jgi:hypothetical protein